MIKRMLPLLFLVCLSFSQARVSLCGQVPFGVEKIGNIFSKTVGCLDRHVGSIALTGAALTIGYAALNTYLMNCRYRKINTLCTQHEQALNNMRSKSQELVECKKWADNFYMVPFDELGIDSEIIHDRASWTCAINNLSKDNVFSFARALGQHNLVALDLKAKLQYAEKIFGEYKDCYGEVEQLTRELAKHRYVDNVILANFREELAYCMTMVPVYLNKMAFIQKLVELRRYDFEQVAREENIRYEESCCDGSCCCNSCMPCSCCCN